MELNTTIAQLRARANLSQEQFAELLGVSRQSVQKWESGASAPELDKLIRIAKHFDISLDTLILGTDNRAQETLTWYKDIQPQYETQDEWDEFTSDLMTEYRQCEEEGLDIAPYRNLFSAVSLMPKGEMKKKFADLLYEITTQVSTRPDYPYIEPSDLEGIFRLRNGETYAGTVPSDEILEKKVHGAWMGRICGCLLGHAVECIKTNELIPFLKETGNYPMHRFILRSDLTDDILNRYNFRFAGRVHADTIAATGEGMKADDDTNYTVLSQLIIEKYGRDFTSWDLSRAWLQRQPIWVYCTGERLTAYNFLRGYAPPASASYKNPYREWIGAQIRGDYWGYINPGDPETAAEMAYRDACVSHIKNGIYGEMFVSAMLAHAAVCSDLMEIIRCGLSQIPTTSRFYEAVDKLLKDYSSGMREAECFAAIHRRYDEHDQHEWCHVISNALVVVACLLYGGGDYSRSICMAVETGFDTDCNAATVGSILGMAYGLDIIDRKWTDPIQNKLRSAVWNRNVVYVTDCVEKTMQHIHQK